MADFENLYQAIIKGDIRTAVSETQSAVDGGSDAQKIVDQGLIAAMDEVGDNFSKGKLFVPQMLRSAKAMQACMDILKSHFQEGEMTTKGNVVIGTVKGDLHDIGKNLVAMMMEGAGFTITDLGVDVSPETFAQKVKEINADIIAMSALLSITMPSMKSTIDELQKAGIRDRIKVMIGGAPVTEKYAQEIRADSYAPDAASAVTSAKKLLGLS